MSAYYNENDPKAAAVLRELSKFGIIAPGDVDERDIRDVLPRELAGYTQVHLFAGFGIWSYAFKLAGWPDSRPVWSASCPCQPFSAAGEGNGFSDERHLWPACFHLVQHGKRPDIPLYGEQVASPDALAWLDLVQADMEAAHHSVRTFDLCAAGFGAPIVRQRLFWLASSESERYQQLSDASGESAGILNAPFESEECLQSVSGYSSGVSGLASANSNGQHQGRECKSATRSDGIIGNDLIGGLDGAVQPGLEGFAGDGDSQTGWQEPIGSITETGELSGLGGSSRSGLAQRECERSIQREEMESCEGQTSQCGSDTRERTGATNGFWRDADWLYCRDDKWRPVEPGTFPLADGYPHRVGILRGAGNAINAEVAKAFIQVTM